MKSFFSLVIGAIFGTSLTLSQNTSVNAFAPQTSTVKTVLIAQASPSPNPNAGGIPAALCGIAFPCPATPAKDNGGGSATATGASATVNNNQPANLPSAGSPSGAYLILRAKCDTAEYEAGSTTLRTSASAGAGNVVVSVTNDSNVESDIKPETKIVAQSMASIFKKVAAGEGNLCARAEKKDDPSGKAEEIPQGDPLPKGNPQGEPVELTPPGKPVRALY
jgi:hypothetical protein